MHFFLSNFDKYDNVISHLSHSVAEVVYAWCRSARLFPLLISPPASLTFPMEPPPIGGEAPTVPLTLSVLTRVSGYAKSKLVDPTPKNRSYFVSPSYIVLDIVKPFHSGTITQKRTCTDFFKSPMKLVFFLVTVGFYCRSERLGGNKVTNLSTSAFSIIKNLRQVR